MSSKSRGTSWRSACAVCPFYRSDTSTTITCEGLSDDSVIKLIYQNRSSCDIQYDTFCSERYSNCEIYCSIVDARYADDGYDPSK